MVEENKVLSNKKESNERKPMYQSKEGFETVPLIRGFDLIRPLWTVLEHVKSETGKDCFICGGYARWCASPRKNPVVAQDIDVYCETEDMYNLLRQKIEALGLTVRHENDVALTYIAPEEGTLKYLPTIQLIKPIRQARMVAFGDKEMIIRNFDFTVIRAAILSSTQVLVDADFMHDEENRLIRLKNIHCPVSSALRCMKYSRKGYFLRPFECLKLFLDWEDRDDEYKQKLVDFLNKAGDGTGLTQEEVDELEAIMRID
jgi:hypothetical protein